MIENKNKKIFQQDVNNHLMVGFEDAFLENKQWWVEWFSVLNSDCEESHKSYTLCVKLNNKVYRGKIDGMKIESIRNKYYLSEADKEVIFTELRWAIETIKLLIAVDCKIHSNSNILLKKLRQ